MTRKRVSMSLLAAALSLSAAACGGPKHAAASPDSAPPSASAAASEPAAASAAAPPRFEEIPATDVPVAPPPAPPTDASRAYTVAVEDILEISIYGDPELTRLVPVRPDGKISYTFVGDVEAAGRTIEEIRAELRDKLSAYLRTPEVTVIAREFGRQKVYIGGEVRQPGVIYLTPRENTLIDVVYRAGLTTQEADLEGAMLMRQGKIVPVDFARAIKGDAAANVLLQNNDLVYIPESAQRYIYILGEVRQQQALETQIPLDLITTIAKAGGVLPASSKAKEVAVLRGGLKNPKVAIVNYRRLLEGDFSQNIEVRPGDIVYVPMSGIGRYNLFLEQILRTFTVIFQGRVIQEGFQ